MDNEVAKLLYLSGVQEFDDFMESGVWKDMITELTLWLGRIRNELEDPNSDASDKTLHRLGGSAEAVRMALTLPDSIRENIKASIEAKNNEEG